MLYLVTAAAFVVGLGSSGALAQTYGADDGNPAVTEPGGTMGRDGAENVRQGVRDGEAVGVPRGTVVDEGRIERQAPSRLPPEAR